MTISPHGLNPPPSIQRARDLLVDDAAFAAPRRCAGCGVRLGETCEARLPFVYFCDECWALASPPESDEELGVGD